MSWGCPLSVGIDVASGAAPRSSMRSVSMIALMTKALPVWRWHILQWQQWTNIGADVSRYRTAPQEQPPVMAGVYGQAGKVRYTLADAGDPCRGHEPRLRRG